MNLEESLKTFTTILCQTISIISLFFLLIIYLSFKALSSNLAGRILISLSLALLLSQFVFLIANYSIELPPTSVTSLDHAKCFKNEFSKATILNSMKSWCYILAVLTHYFYLSFFFWTNIISYDFYRIFTKMRPQNLSNNSSGSQRKRFIKYSLYAWLSPLILVIVLNVEPFVNSGDRAQLKYTYRNCFISESIDNLIYFIIPVIVVLILNFFMFTRSVLSIRNVDKLNKDFAIKDKKLIKNSSEKSKKF
jgi:hypothetical protein